MQCPATAVMAMVAVLAAVVDSRLVFPPGSDMGYIIPDDPESEKYDDDTSWQNYVDLEDDKTQLPQRGAREALKQVDEALWDILQSSVRQEDNRLGMERREDTVKSDPVENWHGRWFPHPPQPDTRMKDEELPDSLKDDKHGIAMGVPHKMCDNGKVNLTVDWDYSPINYTCFDPKHHRLPVQTNLSSVEQCIYIPKGYTPQHLCMYHTITYNTTLPTFGPHRPIWPVYGEYKFVPVQRWLHSIEHGAIVMLYDPCTEPMLVSQLRNLLTACLRKHIITPYTLLTQERPLALLAWGCSLEMSNVNATEVKEFIKKRALHGPEGHYPRNGGFKEGLIRRAEYPPGAEGKDSNLCPE